MKKGTVQVGFAFGVSVLLSNFCIAQVRDPSKQAEERHREAREEEEKKEAPPQETQKPQEQKQEKRQTEALSELQEERPKGPYGQPEWTTKRRFPETRVYVIPENQVEFEWWLIFRDHKHAPNEFENQFEAEFGLPERFQLDLYLVSHKFDTGEGNSQKFSEEKFELRWALADWGKIWGNPALYLEWKALDAEPDHVEAKLLLGGEIAPRWHAGLNFVFEHEMGGAQENSNELTAGVSYTLIDEKLSIGAEAKFAFVDTKATRGNYDHEFLIGPSVQYRPRKNVHLDLAPLVGISQAAPNSQIMFVFGWEF